MSKLKFIILGSALLFNATIFGAVTAEDTSTITLTAISIPTISVENIDFGDYVIGDAKPSQATANITISNGAEGRTVNLSLKNADVNLINAEDDQKLIGTSLTLGDSTEENVDVVLDSAGTATSKLKVSIDTVPDTIGQYEGTATVVIGYN